MPNITSAKRFGTIVLFVRLGNGAEVLDPVLALVESIRVIDHVAHLMPQVAQDIPTAQALHVAGTLEMQRRQVRTREIKRNGDGYRTERYPPFGRKIKTRPHAPNPRPLKLGLELLKN